MACGPGADQTNVAHQHTPWPVYNGNDVRLDGVNVYQESANVSINIHVYVSSSYRNHKLAFFLKLYEIIYFNYDRNTETRNVIDTT